MEFVCDRQIRLQSYLKRVLPAATQTHLQACINKGTVRVNGSPFCGLALAAGDVVEIPLDSALLDVVYEDEQILVINKWQGIAVTEDKTLTLSDYATSYCNAPVFPCHRIDFNTGGLVLFAKTQIVLQAAFAAFANGAVKKYYECIVSGVAQPIMDCYAYLKKDAKREIGRAHV